MGDGREGRGVTALQPHPGPEKPEKGEKPPEPDAGVAFPGFSPFSGPGAMQDAAPSGAAAALAALRSYRRVPPPEPPRAARSKPDAAPPPPPRARRVSAAPTPPGVPLDWCEGVATIAARPAPPAIPPRRWAVLAATCDRLLRDHGAELHRAGWDATDLWGLDAIAPAARPDGWGVAWLLGDHGDVLDVAPDVIGMRQGPGGARLTYRRPGASARAGTVPAWLL